MNNYYVPYASSHIGKVNQWDSLATKNASTSFIENVLQAGLWFGMSALAAVKASFQKQPA